jgi:hypothetical protein
MAPAHRESRIDCSSTTLQSGDADHRPGPVPGVERIVDFVQTRLAPGDNGEYLK